LPGRAFRCLSLLFAGSLELQTTTAAAQRPSVVVSYDADSTSPLLVEARTRLVAELRVAGFDVEPTSSRENGVGTTPTIGNEASVYADVALSAPSEQLELAVSDHSRAIANRLVLVGKRDDVAAVAIQAVEFLRAGLVPRLAPAPPVQAAVSTVSAPEVDRASAPSPESQEARQLRLDLGPTLLTNLGKADRLALLSVRPSLALSTHWSVAASFDAPLGSSGRAEASLGAGLGLARVLSTGAPDAPLVPRQAAAWSLTLGLRAAYEYRIIPAFRVVVAAELLSLSPAPVVAVLTDERRLGSPAAVFDLAARFAL
jgi:hypothetical protein